MHTLRTGLLLILAGTALPIICLPVLSGYEPRAGVLSNIQEMTLQVLENKLAPDFRPVSSIDMASGLKTVDYGSTGTVLAFPDWILEKDIVSAIKAEPQLQSKPLPKFMRFYGWTVVRHAVNIPFRYIILSGLVLVFAGSILSVWSATQRKG